MLNSVNSRRFGNNPFISQDVSAVRPESNVHSARASNDAHVIRNMRAREELNKFKVYVHAAWGKRFKFEDHPSFFSLSGCSTTVHLLDHRHFHILDVVVVGQIEVLGHGKTSSMIAGIMIVTLHRPKVLIKTVRKFTAGDPLPAMSYAVHWRTSRKLLILA